MAVGSGTGAALADTGPLVLQAPLLVQSPGLPRP